jgi:hypothetical protein
MTPYLQKLHLSHSRDVECMMNRLSSKIIRSFFICLIVITRFIYAAPHTSHLATPEAVIDHWQPTITARPELAKRTETSTITNGGVYPTPFTQPLYGYVDDIAQIVSFRAWAQSVYGAQVQGLPLQVNNITISYLYENRLNPTGSVFVQSVSEYQATIDV